MKIIITTPLYPPEIAEPAPYVINLAKILKNKNLDITIITYSLIPEKINGVKIISINKHLPLLIRLFLFTFKLWKNSKNTDFIYTLNGASVELPIIIVSKLTNKSFIINIGDKKATLRTQQNKFFKYIQYLTLKNSKKIINEIPLSKPEITPFDKKDIELVKYRKSWENHINNLLKIFKNVNR